MQLGSQCLRWRQFFNALGEKKEEDMQNVLYDAFSNYYANTLTAAVYRLYDESREVVVSFILNGVSGRVSENLG